MKRQGIVITLEMLEQIKKDIDDAIEGIKKLGLSTKGKKKIGFQFNIVNYPTKYGNRTKYLSDTWQFEGIDKNKEKK